MVVEPSFSMPEHAPVEDKQPRRQARKPLYLRIAESGPDSAIIMDISVGGALLRTSQPVKVGDAVAITLPHGAPIDARVTWSNGPLAGCQFTTPITDAQVSAALLKSAPIPADAPERLSGMSPVIDAPDAERLAFGVPMIVGISALLWTAIAAVVFL